MLTTHSICLVSILRAVWINALFETSDFTWDYVSIVNWTSVEVNTSIVCACLLVMKPLIMKLWRKLRPNHGGSRTENSGNPVTIGGKSFRSNSTPGPSFARTKDSSGSERTLTADLDEIPMDDVESQRMTAMMGVEKPAKTYTTG